MDLHQSKNLFKEKPKTFDFVLLSLLTAMNMVLGEVLCITISTEIKIGFSFIPIFIAAYYYGVLGGVIVSGLGDFIAALIFPHGPFQPLFTLTAVITGALFGLFLKNNVNIYKIILAVLSTQIICSLILNSLWIALLYATIEAFPLKILTRLPQVISMIPVQIILIPIIIKTGLSRLNIIKK